MIVDKQHIFNQNAWYLLAEVIVLGIIVPLSVSAVLKKKQQQQNIIMNDDKFLKIIQMSLLTH